MAKNSSSPPPPADTLPPGSTILVTGAAGGVGTHVVARLLEETDFIVRAVDLMPFGSSFLGQDEWFMARRDRIEWVRESLDAFSDMDALLRGCQAVVHTAALVSLSEDYQHFEPSNVHLTRDLWQACQRNPEVSHMVHLSCATLYKTDGAGVVCTEESPVEATNGYEESKLRAEQVFSQHDDASKTAWTILRPALVYGPFCTTMSAGVVTLPPVLKGVLPYLPGLTGGPRNNWCHAEDVAAAAVFALGHRPQTRARILNVGDDTPLGLGEVLTSITESYALSVGPLIPFPSKLTDSLVFSALRQDTVVDTTRNILKEVWKRVQANHNIRSPLRPRVDKKAMMYAAGDTLVSAAALRDLGWTPRWGDFRQGIAQTVLWYQSKGWLPSYDRETLREVETSGLGEGVRFSENLSGTLTTQGGPALEARLELDVTFDSVWRLWPWLDGTLDGLVSIERHASKQPVEGTIRVMWRKERRVVYDMGFHDDKGRVLRFRGEKALAPTRPLASLRNLRGQLVDAKGTPLGTLQATFELSEQWLPLLVSFRALRQRVPRV